MEQDSVVIPRFFDNPVGRRFGLINEIRVEYVELKNGLVSGCRVDCEMAYLVSLHDLGRRVIGTRNSLVSSQRTRA